MDPQPRPPLRRRLLPVLGLAFLAPWVGEYLLGSHTLRDLPIIVFLVPLYGGAALLVREVARRTGRGWPAMLLLAAAYGVIQAGVVDRSLFDPDFAGYDFQTVAHVPGIDLSAYHLLLFVSGHAIYSIGTPIAIVESLLPDRREEPWLGMRGLAGVVLLYLLGVLLIGAHVRATEDFTQRPAQYAAAVGAGLALVAAAFAVPRRLPAAPGTPPRAGVTGAAAFVAAGLLISLHPSWAGVGYGVVVGGGAVWAVTRWSRRPGWTQRHRAALAVAALLTYAWAGFTLHPYRATSPAFELASDVTYAGCALLLGVLTLRRARIAQASPSHASPSAPAPDSGISGSRSPQP